MKQYCRYCVHLVTCNGTYCSLHEKELSESYAKVPNRCKDFDFCEIDAFAENQKPYRPRGEKRKKHELPGEDNVTMFQVVMEV